MKMRLVHQCTYIFILTFICPVVSAGAEGTAGTAEALDAPEVVGSAGPYCAVARTGRRKQITDFMNISKSCNREVRTGLVS